MRQTGVIAACGAYALTHNFPQLPRVHALTLRLEKGLEELGAEITSRAETCTVSGLLPVFFRIVLFACYYTAILRPITTWLKLF